ncbi:MAG: hypothetical protein IJ343_04440 [Clostridia bacterium]|nr:hypothetical protein [Clostridia bacterium]
MPIIQALSKPSRSPLARTSAQSESGYQLAEGAGIKPDSSISHQFLRQFQRSSATEPAILLAEAIRQKSRTLMRPAQSIDKVDGLQTFKKGCKPRHQGCKFGSLHERK